MELLFGAFALLVLMAVNYWTARTRRPAAGKLVLLVTSLPAVALIGFFGFHLAYAIVNADEVNRRFQQGDLTHFGADVAFATILLLGGLWTFLAYFGHRWGRSDRS